MKATQTVDLEIGDLEITAHMTAVVTLDDYGVDRSPVFCTYDDIEADTIEVNGEEFTEKEALAKFGQDVMSAIYGAANDDAWDYDDFGYDDCDWEFDE